MKNTPKGLNEELMKMRKLMDFDISKNSHDVLSESNIRKSVLSEQGDPDKDDVTQKGQGKWGDNPDVLSDEKYMKVSNSFEVKFKEKNPNFDSQLSELNNNLSYPLLMKKLDKEERKIFYLSLTQKSRMFFLDKTLTFLRSFTKKRKLERRLKKDPNYTHTWKELHNWNADLKTGNKTKEVIPIINEEVPEIKIEEPLYVKGKTVYKDNSKEPDVSLINIIDEWVNNVNLRIEQYKLSYPNLTAELTSADIASSCSRLRNTGLYDGKTWKELSTDRAEEVYKILVEKLNSIGVTVSSDVVKIIRGGKNKSGDGSSGPDAAKKFVFDTGKKTSSMSYSKTGADTLYGPDKDRFVGEYGKLMSSQAESHQYKFCAIMATILVKGEGEQVEPLQPEVLHWRGFSLILKPEYYSKTPKRLRKGSRWKPSGKTFDTPKWKIPMKKVKTIIDDCPIFN